MTEQQHGRPTPAMDRWVMPGVVIASSLVAVFLLPGARPMVWSVLGLVVSSVSAIACGAATLQIWRSGPAPGRGRGAHAVLVGIMLLLAVMGVLLTLAALGAAVGQR